MKYTKEERLDIGQKIYDGQISRYEAAEQYGISDQTARDYMRLYRDTHGLPPKRGERALAVPSLSPSRKNGQKKQGKSGMILMRKC